MRISDWSSDVCSSDLNGKLPPHADRRLCLWRRGHIDRELPHRLDRRRRHGQLARNGRRRTRRAHLHRVGRGAGRADRTGHLWFGHGGGDRPRASARPRPHAPPPPRHSPHPPPAPAPPPPPPPPPPPRPPPPPPPPP